MGSTLTRGLKKYMQHELIRENTNVYRRLKDLNPMRGGILLNMRQNILERHHMAGVSSTGGGGGPCECFPVYRTFRNKSKT